MRENILFVLFGTAFGFVLSRSGAADYNFIQGMFLLTNLQLYGILAVAVTITAIGLQILRRGGRTLGGEPIVIQTKALNRGTVIGGLIFGVGWSITGMCPGPVLVNIGEGKLFALAAFAGVLTGVYLVAHTRLGAEISLPKSGTDHSGTN